MDPQSSPSTSTDVFNIQTIISEPRLVGFPVESNPVQPIPASEATCTLALILCVELDISTPNLTPATGDYIHLRSPTAEIHYGVRVVAYCETTSLHRVVYDSDECDHSDDVNLNLGGLDWHYAFDPYIGARNVFPTHTTARFGLIVRLTDEDDVSIAFSRIALVHQYCPASNSTCTNRRVPCRMNLSALCFIVFYVRTATTEVRDFTNTTVVIVR